MIFFYLGAVSVTFDYPSRPDALECVHDICREKNKNGRHPSKILFLLPPDRHPNIRLEKGGKKRGGGKEEASQRTRYLSSDYASFNGKRSSAG